MFTFCFKMKNPSGFLFCSEWTICSTDLNQARSSSFRHHKNWRDHLRLNHTIRHCLKTSTLMASVYPQDTWQVRTQVPHSGAKTFSAATKVLSVFTKDRMHLATGYMLSLQCTGWCGELGASFVYYLSYGLITPLGTSGYTSRRSIYMSRFLHCIKINLWVFLVRVWRIIYTIMSPSSLWNRPGETRVW